MTNTKFTKYYLTDLPKFPRHDSNYLNNKRCFWDSIYADDVIRWRKEFVAHLSALRGSTYWDVHGQDIIEMVLEAFK